jgi:hypothetical protein
MASPVRGLAPFIGTWDANTFYDRGDVVLRSGVLYQARSDRGDTKDPTSGAAYWANVSSTILTLTGSIDPTTGAGIPSAISSTYHMAGTALYVKTGSGATAWSDPAAGGGGGGSTIAATDTQIVFMDGTDAVGSANLTFVEAGGDVTLGLAAGENDHATISTLGVGAEISIQAADGDATHVGGELTLVSGNSGGQNGGQVNIFAGADTDGGDGGAVIVSSGNAPSGKAGDIDLRVGSQGDSAEGGSINIVAGTGQTDDGGSVIIQAGPNVTGGSHGSVQLYDGSSNNGLELNANGLIYFGAAPEVPATPTAQDIVDALVAIGFITQAS